MPTSILSKIFGIAVTLVVVTSFNAPANAQGTESSNAQLVAERPNASGKSTVVTVRVFLIDIDEINDVRQRFTVDMFINIAWQDPRLALPEEARFGQIRTIPMNAIWTPRGLVVNDRGLAPQLPLVVDIDELGNVVYRQRLSGELAVDLDLKDFPFDSQTLLIDVISYQYRPDEIQFSKDSGMASNLAAFSVEGWSFSQLETNFDEFSAPTVGVVRPRVTFTLEAQRISLYYVLTMFLPMSLIIFMSWTAFWIQPNVVPPRIAISTASIFSLIAFGFSIRLGLPRVSYVTRADMFVIGCTLLVFLALGAAVIGSRWAGEDRLERAVRLNAAIRWIYAGLFVVVATASLTL